VRPNPGRLLPRRGCSFGVYSIPLLYESSVSTLLGFIGQARRVTHPPSILGPHVCIPSELELRWEVELLVTDQPVTSGDVISFELETADLWLSRLIESAEIFSALLREVSREIMPAAGVRWIVESISMASPVSLAVRPTVVDSDLPTDALNNLAETVIGGLELVQSSAQRPMGFSDTALKQAKLLARQAAADRTHVRFASRGRKRPRIFEVTAQFISHVDEILGQTLSAVGTVEGRLEAFNVHGGNRYFNVYDALTDARIRCEFGYRIPVRAIGAAAEQRVAVQGEIFYRESGDIERVRAQSLEVFPEEEDLPSADAAKGILAR